jgi:hypothetical protein
MLSLSLLMLHNCISCSCSDAHTLAFSFVSSQAWRKIQGPHETKFKIFSSVQPQTYAASATVHTRLDRPTAQQITDTILCPPEEERDRNNAGMQAFDTAPDQYRGNVIENNDPRTQFTYGEFPFDSFDLLVDRALELMGQTEKKNHQKSRNVMVDLGSGCGRLVLYAALTRCNEATQQREESSVDQHTIWDFHGIEIASKLHHLAVSSLQKGVDNELYGPASSNEIAESSNSKIAFHNGNALLVEDPYFPLQSSDGSDDNAEVSKEIQSIISQSTLVFAYSTVWETDPVKPFDPDLQAMILSPKWSQTLAGLCPSGCVAVTTDRALNPRDGWRLLDSMEVDNPSVWGSVGYISVLEK